MSLNVRMTNLHSIDLYLRSKDKAVVHKIESLCYSTTMTITRWIEPKYTDIKLKNNLLLTQCMNNLQGFINIYNYEVGNGFITVFGVT